MWKAAKDRRGYGRFQLGRGIGTCLSHRLAWELAYGQRPDMHVCRRSAGTTTIEYRNAAGECLTSLDKHIGSDLAMLHTAIRDLDRMLEPNSDELLADAHGPNATVAPGAPRH